MICPAVSSLVISGSSFDAVAGDDGDNVGISGKACALLLEIVCNHHIGVFLSQLCPGVFQKIFCFHREAAEELSVWLVLARYF